MGSHWFSGCDATTRFTRCDLTPRPMEREHRWVVWDWDQRRPLDVHIPLGRPDDAEWLFESLHKFIDTIPRDVTRVTLDDRGALVSSSSNPCEAHAWVAFYPLRTEFPRRVATVRRQHLTEVDRLGLQVDLVTYSPHPGETRQAVFKYYVSHANTVLWWNEANCVMRIPSHPNIVPLDALVVDSIDGIDRVVGFTTRYVPGFTLHENDTRVFKLKYLEQLISVVDYLNLELGIVHGDICPWNLLIDPVTDNIQLFDFNSAAKLGWKGDEEHNYEFEYKADRNDVKFTIFTTYELITRKFNFRQEFYPEELDAAKIMKQKTWKKHADTQLDSPVTQYRRVLAEWVKKRAAADKKVDHFSKAANPLTWPPLNVDDPFLYNYRSPLRRLGRMRGVMVELEKDFLRWQRPPACALPLPEGQRLLATGQVVDEDGSVVVLPEPEGQTGQGGTDVGASAGSDVPVET